MATKKRRKRKETRGVIVHHTATRTLEQALRALRSGGKTVHAIIDRDGTVHELVDRDVVGGHTMPSKAYGKFAVRAPGLSNANTYGIEVVGRGNDDITPEQIAAGAKFASEIAQSYGLDPKTSVFGHGEVTPTHRQLTEGMGIVGQIRTGTPITVSEKQFEKLYGPKSWADGDFLLGGAPGKAAAAVMDLVRGKENLLGEAQLKKGMVSPKVATLQRALETAGYSVGPQGADGKFGEATEAALKRFQQDRGLEPVGYAGPKTRAALHDTLTGTMGPGFDEPTGVTGTIGSRFGYDPFGVGKMQNDMARAAALSGPGFDEPTGVRAPVRSSIDVFAGPGFDEPTGIKTIGQTVGQQQNDAFQQAIKDGWTAKAAAIRSGRLDEPPVPRFNPRFELAAGSNSNFADPAVDKTGQGVKPPNFDDTFRDPFPAIQTGRGIKDTFDILSTVNKYSGNDAVSAPASAQAPATIGSSARSSAGATSTFDVPTRTLVGSAPARAVKALPTNAGSGGGVPSQVGYGGTGSPEAQKAAVTRFQSTGQPATIGQSAQHITPRPAPTPIKPTVVRTVSIPSTPAPKPAAPKPAAPTISAAARAALLSGPGFDEPTGIKTIGQAAINQPPIPRPNQVILSKLPPATTVPAYKVTDPVDGFLPAPVKAPVPIGMTAQHIMPMAPVEQKPFINLPLPAKMALGAVFPGIGMGISLLNKAMLGFPNAGAKMGVSNVEKSGVAPGGIDWSRGTNRYGQKTMSYTKNGVTHNTTTIRGKDFYSRGAARPSGSSGGSSSRSTSGAGSKSGGPGASKPAGTTRPSQRD